MKIFVSQVRVGEQDKDGRVVRPYRGVLCFSYVKGPTVGCFREIKKMVENVEREKFCLGGMVVQSVEEAKEIVQLWKSDQESWFGVSFF